MLRFWGLMGLAFVDLLVAGVLVGWGERDTALLFVGLALVSAVIALLWTPAPRRDARGRLQAVELPYGKVVGALGAVVILGGAAYVATLTSQPARPLPPVPAPAPHTAVAPRTPAPVSPPRARPAPAGTGLLYKCVARDGHASYQSQPCPPDARREWVRDATPEPPPTAAQLAARRRQALEQERARRAGAARNTGYWAPPPSGGSNPRAACRAARDADAAYRRQPLKYVTHDGLRRHGDAIREACG